jgi:hypothetical protein
VYAGRVDATDKQMHTLANAMGHSVDVQRSHYAYQQRLQRQGALQAWLTQATMMRRDGEEEKMMC